MEAAEDLALMDTEPDNRVVIDGCNTVSGLFWKRVTELADKVVIREKDFGIWNEFTWGDFGEQARLAGLGLKSLGLERGDICSVASEINKEWMFADLGIIGVGGVANGVYPTDAPNQVEYLINDSRSKFYFAEDEEQLDKVLEVRERTPTLEKIIIFDMEGLRKLDDEQCMSFEALLELGREYGEQHPDAWASEIEAADPEDLMVLVYTSGTTGMPKGSMVNQRNMMFMMEALQVTYGIYDTDEALWVSAACPHSRSRLLHIFGNRVLRNSQFGRKPRDDGPGPAGSRTDSAFRCAQGLGKTILDSRYQTEGGDSARPFCLRLGTGGRISRGRLSKTVQASPTILAVAVFLRRLSRFQEHQANARHQQQPLVVDRLQHRSHLT